MDLIQKSVGERDNYREYLENQDDFEIKKILSHWKYIFREYFNIKNERIRRTPNKLGKKSKSEIYAGIRG